MQRAETEHIPIIFLSAKTEEDDQVKGLMLGSVSRTLVERSPIPVVVVPAERTDG